MDPSLAARFPFEVLHGVRQVDRRARQAGVREGTLEQSACRTDEGMPLPIFLIAWLLAYQHDGRTAWAFAEHGLSGLTREIATAALLRGVGQDAQTSGRGHKGSCTWSARCSFLPRRHPRLACHGARIVNGRVRPSEGG